MADMKWTKEQQQVIDLRDCSMLVSAAAGSGKTAVLVQRILSMITDVKHPMDIDRLLVVTFTNAAASEMRERIANALEKKLQETPDGDPLKAHLLKQTTLVHNALITTIDSFCLSVIRNHFHTIDLEPGFRIADEGELKLLREDICAQVLNTFYEEKDEAFLRFTDSYSSPKNDDYIREMILKLYDYSQSNPWPEEWLETCREWYNVDTVEDLTEKDWMQGLYHYVRVCVMDMAVQYETAHALTLDPDGPEVYEGNIRDELSQLQALLSCDSYEDWREGLLGIRFEKLPGARKYTGSLDKKKQVTDIRDAVKKAIKTLKENYFSLDLEEQVNTLKKTGEMANQLIDLTLAFSRAFRQEKEKKNIQDFSDIEHNALRVLVNENRETTAVAAEYREQFLEVMIDEYQDSNFLQEAILSAVCGHAGKNNMFMVGDVKQSIYRFRLARPELFTEKYSRFSEVEGASEHRIDLHKNFRSRTEVVQVVNDIFSCIMGKDLGNVEYDADASLNFGAEYYMPYETPKVCETETIVISEDIEEDKVSAEARVIAYRIRQLIEEQEFPVSEANPKKEYRDVVILLRSLAGWAEVFQKVFDEEGIPLIVSSRRGYFSAREIQVILSMLRLIDNAQQDIPLASVMKSEIGGFSATELALIKASAKNSTFYQSVWNYPMLEDANPVLKKKIESFSTMIQSFRDRVPDVSIHELILQILDETGYRSIVSAMPAGEKRKANLDMLVEKAISYENTSYHGLFHFIRYMDQLQKYDVDYGEAEVVSEQENAVRLMTIHSSKGLEYPIVFVSGMGKQLNDKDSTGTIVFHPVYGFGLKLCDCDTRTKKDTLIRRILSLEAKKESMGEELRILYVALTRAKEKLIMTGCAKAEEESESLGGNCGRLSFTKRLDAKCFFDLVIPALQMSDGKYEITEWDFQESVRQEVKKQYRLQQKRTMILDAVSQYDSAIYEEVKERLSWSYPYAEDYLPKQKISVSELKHRAMDLLVEEEDVVERDYEETELVPYVPQFIEAAEENIGALKGTATHRILECYPFAQLPDFISEKEATAHVFSFLDDLVVKKRMSSEDASLVNCKQVGRFLCSDTAKEMRNAAVRGMLKKEQPFVMSLDPKERWEESRSTEKLLIQGIIDVFWQDEEGITLLDYKTDRVSSEKQLAERYEKQLVLYAQALNRNFDPKKVKHILIYSFCLEKVIEIEWSE